MLNKVPCDFYYPHIENFDRELLLDVKIHWSLSIHTEYTCNDYTCNAYTCTEYACTEYTCTEYTCNDYLNPP